MITQQLNSAIELIRHPERMDRSTIPVLQEALERYPFYQTLHLLLLQNMYKVHDPAFSLQLRKSAVMVADRSVLFDMVEGLNYVIPVSKLDDDDNAKNKGGDKTLKLIDDFLKGIPEQPSSQAASSDSVDSTGDYSAFLEQLPDIDNGSESEPISLPKTTQPLPATGMRYVVDEEREPRNENNSKPETEPLAETPQTSTSSKTDNTLPSYDEDEEFTAKFVNSQNENDDVDEESQKANPNDEMPQEKEFFTETMAGLYIKQQKYEQALEIIKAINAENPKKSVYFADQIRYLELLIRIYKNKNNRNV